MNDPDASTGANTACPRSPLSLIDSLHRIIEELREEFEQRNEREASLQKTAEQAQRETNAWKECYHQLLDQLKRGAYPSMETPPLASSDVDMMSFTTRSSTPVSLEDGITVSPSVVTLLPREVIKSPSEHLEVYPPPAPRPPPAILTKLKRMPQLCFDHYLSPRGCEFPGFITGKHGFHHDYHLHPAEIAGHRYMTQAFRCGSGQFCADPDCYLGHACPGVCKGQGRGTMNWQYGFEDHIRMETEYQKCVKYGSDLGLLNLSSDCLV